MTYKLSNLLWSVIIFGCLALLGYIIGIRQRDGIISVIWLLYIAEWWLFGGLGLVLFLLRKFRLFNVPAGLLYTYCGVANLCNAGIGAYFLWAGNSGQTITNILLWMGATACVAFLIFVDVFL